MQPGGELLQLAGVAAEPEAVGLGEDLGGAQPAAAGQQDDGVGRGVGQALHPLAGALDQRQGGDELRGDVGADLGGEGGKVVDLAGGEPQDRRGVGAAAAQPGGDRDSLLDPDPHRRMVPTPRPQARQRPGGEVLALDPGTDDLVALPLGDLDRVGQGQRLEQRAELVEPVLASRPT